MSLYKEIEAYEPCNEQEALDRRLFLYALGAEPNVFTRANLLVHVTASAWVTNKDYSKVLMAYHNIYDSWAWLGGHADGEEDLLAVALREVKEESGLSRVSALSDEIFSLESITVDGHEKNGAYVSSHLHLNATYLLQANDKEKLRPKPDENSKVGWFSPEDAIAVSREPWFKERIYPKLNEKLAAYAAEHARKGWWR